MRRYSLPHIALHSLQSPPHFHHEKVYLRSRSSLSIRRVYDRPVVRSPHESDYAPSRSHSPRGRVRVRSLSYSPYERFSVRSRSPPFSERDYVRSPPHSLYGREYERSRSYSPARIVDPRSISRPRIFFSAIREALRRRLSFAVWEFAKRVQAHIENHAKFNVESLMANVIEGRNSTRPSNRPARIPQPPSRPQTPEAEDIVPSPHRRKRRLISDLQVARIKAAFRSRSLPGLIYTVTEVAVDVLTWRRMPLCAQQVQQLTVFFEKAKKVRAIKRRGKVGREEQHERLLDSWRTLQGIGWWKRTFEKEMMNNLPTNHETPQMNLFFSEEPNEEEERRDRPKLRSEVLKRSFVLRLTLLFVILYERFS